MRRVLFSCAGIPVYSYPAMLYVGIVLGIYAELYAASKIGLDVVPTLTATLALLSAALLGARLLYVLTEWPFYRERIGEILRFSRGGASMYGGLLLAVPLSVPVLLALGLPIGEFWDVASFTMLTGMIVTRVGCFLNGCCAGRPTNGRWGIVLPNDRGVCRRRIPTQILEGAWGLVVLVGAMLLWRTLPFGGALFLYAVCVYSLGRVVLEPLRDEPDRFMGLPLHTGIALGFVMIGLGALGLAYLW